MTAKQNLSRSGSTFDGVLRKTLEAHCRICGQANLGLSGDHNEAKRELRLEGWETREGLWVCATCACFHPRGTVTFNALAGEAATAAKTPQSGLVHEHATAQPERPKATPILPNKERTIP